MAISESFLCFSSRYWILIDKCFVFLPCTEKEKRKEWQKNLSVWNCFACTGRLCFERARVLMIIAECGLDYSSHMLSVNWQNNYTQGLMALPKRKSERGQNDCSGCMRNSDRVRLASCWRIKTSSACECSLLWVLCPTSPDKGGNVLAGNEVCYWWAYIRWKTLLWSLESGSWMSLRM